MKYELLTCLIILILKTVFVPAASIKISKSMNILQTPQQVNNALSEPHVLDYQGVDEAPDRGVGLSWSPSVGTMQDEKRELKQLEQFNAELEASLKRDGDPEGISNDEDDPRFQKRITEDIHSKVSAIKEEIKRDADVEYTSKQEHNGRNNPTADIMVEGDVDYDKETKHHSSSNSGKAKSARDKECNNKNRDEDKNSDKQEPVNVDQKEGPDDDLFKETHDKDNFEGNKRSDQKHSADDDNAECNRNWQKPKEPPGRKGNQGEYREGRNDPEPKNKVHSVREFSERDEDERQLDRSEPILRDDPAGESSDLRGESSEHWKKRSEEINQDSPANGNEPLNEDQNQNQNQDENVFARSKEEDRRNEEDGGGGAHEEQPENGGEDIDLGLLDIVQTIHALRKRDAVYDRLFGGARREKRSSNSDQRNRRRENYIRDLEDSFPNPNSGSDTEQDSFEPHVRVKRRQLPTREANAPKTKRA